MGIRRDIEENYKSYYSGDELSCWRQLSAEGKARNIVSLTMNYPHHSILEIGAGEGSILQKLRELNYAQALYALEISESGIEAIQKRNIPDLIECKLYDGYEVPYSDKRFDLAILSHVLEHIEYP